METTIGAGRIDAARESEYTVDERGTMMLILSGADVRRLITMREAIDAVEGALVEFSRGQAHMPVRSVTQVGAHHGVMLSMPAFLSHSGALGSKIVTVYKENPQRDLPMILATVLVHDPQTGRLLAMMEGTYLTAIRTAAASGVATKYLARPGPKVLAIIGGGVQGHSHLWAMHELGPLTHVRLHDRTRRKAEAFKATHEPTFRVPIEVVASPEEAVRDADLIILATTAPTPVIQWQWVKPGAHINAVGSHARNTRELDSETIAHARIVVDSREANLTECGDILIPLEEGRVTREALTDEIGEVAAGLKAGRTRPDQVTVFKSVGIAVEDVAAANLIYRKALVQGIGTTVDL